MENDEQQKTSSWPTIKVLTIPHYHKDNFFFKIDKSYLQMLLLLLFFFLNIILNFDQKMSKSDQFQKMFHKWEDYSGY